MGKRQNRSDGKLPLKPEPDIDHDGQKRTNNRQNAFFGEFSTNRWPDKFGSADVIIAAKRVANKLDCGDLRLFVTILALNSDQNIGFGTKALKADIAKTQRFKIATKT